MKLQLTCLSAAMGAVLYLPIVAGAPPAVSQISPAVSLQSSLSLPPKASSDTLLVSTPSLLPTPATGTSLSSSPTSTPPPPSSLQASSTSPSSAPISPSVFATTSGNVTATSTSSSSQPSSTLDPDVLDEITTMTERRLSIIVAGISGAENISQWLSTLNSGGQWPASEVDYTTGCNARRANWPAEEHWIRLLTMSAAWHGGLEGADQYVKDPTLRDQISLGMNWWFDNDFTNPACLDSGGTTQCPCGTPGLWNTNWFSNLILIPNLVSQSCLLLNDTLTNTQHSNCTHITGRTYGALGQNVNGVGALTGANLLDVSKIGIDQGLLNFNVSLLTAAYGAIHGEVVIENAIMADGIRADGSFGQHGGVIYNGNYGKDFANDVLNLEIEAGGTRFAAGPTTQSAFATLIDADQWMIFLNVLTGVLHWDFSVLGRFISFPVIDAQATGSININITKIRELGELWNSTTLTSVYDSLSTKTDDANIGNLVGNRMFYANDYMVQRGPGYVTTVRMFSPRTKNTECLNAQNPLGFHLSDGTVYTYLQGDEYEDIAAAWDWNLIPGTTVDYGATPLSCDHVQFAGLDPFVGGASDGEIGAAAMRYVNPFTKTLSWQKAWFFLDDDVQHVMIPTITSATNSSVFSVLDQKRHNGEVLVNGFPLESKTNFTRPLSLWHDNVGYLFDPANPPVGLSVEVGPRSGNWSAIGISAQGETTVDLFAAWIDHGSVSPIAPVSYTAFPAVDSVKFLGKMLSARLTTVQNDLNVSAIFDEIHRTAMIVFWNKAGGSTKFTPGVLHAPLTITSSGNAIVIYRVDGGHITVSDPSQTLSSVQLTFSVEGLGIKPPGLGQARSKQLAFHLPTGGLAGSSVFGNL